MKKFSRLSMLFLLAGLILVISVLADAGLLGGILPNRAS